MLSGNAQTRTKPVDNITEHQTRRSQAVSSFKQPSAAEKLLSTNKSKARFENWMKAKHNDETEQEESYDHTGNNLNTSGSVYNSQRYSEMYYTDKSYRDHKGSGEVNVLRVPSTRLPEYASPDPGFTSDDDTGEITAATLMSPEDFDSRADDIIARVKGDMKDSNTYTKSHNAFNEVRKSLQPGKRTTSDVQPTSDGSLSSHVCHKCDKLMVRIVNLTIL